MRKPTRDQTFSLNYDSKMNVKAKINVNIMTKPQKVKKSTCFLCMYICKHLIFAMITFLRSTSYLNKWHNSSTSL